MITHKRINEILARFWNMPEATLTDIYYKGTGNRNENAYYVGDKFVIKITGNLGKALSNISLSKALSEHNIPSATPVPTVSDEEYVQDGELYFYLTDRIAGMQVVPELLYAMEYFPDSRYIGELIGRLHSVLKGLDIPIEEVNIYDKVKDKMKAAADIFDLSDEYCNEFLFKFGQIYPLLPVQIIHRDPNPGNIIGEGDKWGFIDFELSEKNVRIFDICYEATAVLSETFDENDLELETKWTGLLKNLIAGYDSVANMTEEEKSAVPYVIMANQIISTVWFAGKEKYADIFEINKKMTLWLMDIFRKPEI